MNWIDAAIAEIKYSIECEKSKEVKEHYLKNALMYLEEYKKELKRIL